VRPTVSHSRPLTSAADEHAGVLSSCVGRGTRTLLRGTGGGKCSPPPSCSICDNQGPSGREPLPPHRRMLDEPGAKAERVAGGMRAHTARACTACARCATAPHHACSRAVAVPPRAAPAGPGCSPSARVLRGVTLRQAMAARRGRGHPPMATPRQAAARRAAAGAIAVCGAAERLGWGERPAASPC
jgi:hypothetical protein